MLPGHNHRVKTKTDVAPGKGSTEFFQSGKGADIKQHPVSVHTVHLTVGNIICRKKDILLLKPQGPCKKHLCRAYRVNTSPKRADVL